MGSAEQSPFLLTMFVALALISWFCHPGQADIVYDLAKQSGAVYLPGQSGFEEKRKVMNAACTAQPAVIVVPNFDQDVSTIIKATKANNLELSVRSGGHSYTCTNIKEGGVHMDMRSFNKLEMVDTALSPTGKALKLGPGRLWGDVLEFAPPETYSYPHGQCRSVGVGGYLLGGGVNWLGTYNKYGYGAEHVLKMKVILADGSVGWVDKDKTDLTAIHNAAKSTNDYSITVSQEFANEFWKKELTQGVYELYPGIMETLKRLNFKSGYPVPLTVTDIRADSGHKTDAAKASDYMKSQGVRMVFEFDLTTNVFHNFAEYLYGNNMVEQRNWEAGKYFLSSLNFGGLEDTSSFQDIFFTDPSFGVKRNDFLEFASHECDYCFWMIHYRNRQRQTAPSQSSPISTNTELENPHVLDTNIVCMFTKANADCPNLIKRVKSQIETNLAGKSYSKYANFPSCSESDWATRYWRNYTQLLDIKATWDPANQFNHCQSVGSTDISCCPAYDQTTGGQTKPCLGVEGPGAGQPCVFPFSYLGKSYNSCTMGGLGKPWCATSVGIIGAMNSWAYCDTQACPVN